MSRAVTRFIIAAVEYPNDNSEGRGQNPKTDQDSKMGDKRRLVVLRGSLVSFPLRGNPKPLKNRLGSPNLAFG
jgi:hypothetical protein